MTRTARPDGHRLVRWLLVVGLAVGLVGMHHLVGGPGGHDHAMSMTVPAVHQTAAGQAPPCGGSSAITADHPCLAVLVDVVALVVTLLVLPGAALLAWPLTVASRRGHTAARAPPVARRLARLQILRL